MFGTAGGREGWPKVGLPLFSPIRPLASRVGLSPAFVSLFRCPQEGTRPKEILLESGLGSAAGRAGQSPPGNPGATCPSRRSPPSLLSAPCAPSTFCELKDWVQWYRTRLSLGQWAGLAASGASGASTGLAASLSSAEMGHQLQLVGVRLLGVAMTARDRRRKEAARQRLAGAQHHMASPSLPLSLLPLLAMSLLTGCKGEGQGDPGARSSSS